MTPSEDEHSPPCPPPEMWDFSGATSRSKSETRSSSLSFDCVFQGFEGLFGDYLILFGFGVSSVKCTVRGYDCDLAFRL